LYIVPTPIGNLDDITRRALNVLKKVDLILAEDTRHTGKLLAHYDIATPMMAFHQHNEHQKLAGLVRMLREGQVFALVTDGGTPGISDPGFLLGRACIDNHLRFECLPGASALIPAVVLSGLPCDRFAFEGFLPAKKGRSKRLQQLTTEQRTMIIYESPHRIAKTLKELAQVLGPTRPAAVCRELTKLHEEVLRGSLADLATLFETKKALGEFVVVVGPPQS
jgi:16S rRNA (cytidine1402-2'-O)-methyltransferase